MRSFACLRWVAALASCAALVACAKANPLPAPETEGSGGKGGGGGGGAGGGSACTPGEQADCYTGPDGTLGVGLCKAGKKTCAPDGKSFGDCAGEVVPIDEDCTTPDDENCNGKADPCPGSLVWGKSYGDTKDQRIEGIAVDKDGGVVLTGYFSGNVNFGGQPLTSAGGSDVFVAKLDKNGQHVWSKRFGDALEQYGYAVAVDDAGDAFVTGEFKGKVNCGGQDLLASGSSDIFVARFDANGNHVWSKRFGDVADQVGRAIAVDATGNVLLTGSIKGSASFGGPDLVSAGGADVFLAKLDGSGSHVWSKLFGSAADSQIGLGVAVDPAGNVSITGAFLGSIDFGGGAITTAGGADVFVARFDGAGTPVWSKRFGDDSDQIGRAIAVDNAGNVVVAGSVIGAIDLGGGALTSAGLEDVFVAKLDGAGKAVWGKIFGDAASQLVHDVSVDKTGDVLLAGGFAGTIDLGGGPLASAGANDVFYARLDAAGAHQQSLRFGDASDQSALAVATDPDGAVLLAGAYQGSIDFGAAQPLQSNGFYDAFIAKLAP